MRFAVFNVADICVVVGKVVLGGNEQPRCVPVDAVDDAGAEGSVDSGE